MTNYSEYTTEELGDLYSDYSKSVYGFRDRTVSYTDREALLAKLNGLDRIMESMKATKKGRNALRNDGWVIKEFEKEDGWDQVAFEQRQGQYYD